MGKDFFNVELDFVCTFLVEVLLYVFLFVICISFFNSFGLFSFCYFNINCCLINVALALAEIK